MMVPDTPHTPDARPPTTIIPDTLHPAITIVRPYNLMIERAKPDSTQPCQRGCKAERDDAQL